ncbi:MAG: glutamine amidotransferase class-I [Bacteroidetes bacterium]|nr:MAG: glutamine amidotransferase class-I [Bacteroidota bacterium]
MIYVVNFGSSKTPKIAECVKSAGTACEIVPWENPGLIDRQKVKGIIFSGSPVFFTETDFTPYGSRYAFIQSGKIPTLGICFGHQLMGLLHGAQIFRGEEVRTTIPVRIMKRDFLFEGLEDTTAMTEDHTEGITLPHGFIHLAASASYTIEGMRHPFLPLWGVQFHPEVSGKNGEILIGNFMAYCNR